MKKHLLTLLTLSFLGLGNAVAQENEYTTFFSENYENATEHGWTIIGGTGTIETNSTTGNKYFYHNVEGSGNRSAYLTFDESTIAHVNESEEWRVCFDASIQQGKQKDRSQTAIGIIGENTTLKNNSTEFSPSFFRLVSPTSDGNWGTTFYLILDTETLATITLDRNVYYHYSINVKGSQVHAVITKDESTILDISYEIDLTAVGALKGIYSCVGRTYGNLQIDNIIVEGYSAKLITPEAEITGVNGTAREVTMSQVTGDNIYWYAGDNAEGATLYTAPIEVAEACTLKIYASDGNNTSEILEFPVAAGTEVKLNTPTFQRVSYNTASKLSDITFYTDQTSVLCQPTATIHYLDGSGKQGTVENGGTVKIALGDLKIWAEAEGYANSDVLTVNVHKAIEYQQIWQEDFTGASGNVTLSTDPVTTISKTNYHSISDENGTFDERFLCADNYIWQANKGGLYSYTSGWRNVCVRDVNAGQYVIFTGTNTSNAYEINAVSANITKDLLETQGESIVFQAEADGDFVFSVQRYNVFYTVGVYAEPHSHEMTPHAVSEGYLTFYNNDLDHIAPNSATVYTVSKSATEGWLTLTEVEDRIIPAGNAVIIQAQAGIPFEVESTDRTEETLENNILKGTETELVLEGDEYVYVLSVDTNKENVGFYKYTGKTLAAGKAYIDPADLDWTASGAPMLRIGAGMTTIEQIGTEETAEQSTYDLLGRRVQAPAQGLYIKGGKKVWVK